jgi:hypothetical protein
MDPRHPPTPHARADAPPPPERRGELDVTTLLIAAAASAAAAFVTSQVWAGGTLWSAAISPVIVALVKEGLARPADKVRTVRLTRVGGGPATAEAEQAEGPPVIVPPGTREEDLGPVSVYGGGRERRVRWTPARVRLAIITGLLAFAAVVVVYTVPELVSGKSIGGGGDHRTTLFGGTPRNAKKTPTPTPTPSAEGTAAPKATTTATPTVTASPSPTVTASPTPVPTVQGVAPTSTPPAGAATPAPTP